MKARRALAAVAAASTMVVVAGCGSGTSVKDFCEAGDAFSKATAFEQGVQAAETLEGTGKPDGMPDDARDGFDAVVELVTDAEDQEDLQQRYADLTAKEKKAVEALDSYIEKTC